MKEMRKSPEEIKRGLATCIIGWEPCTGNCTYEESHGSAPKCMIALKEDALAYIQKLEAQNAELLKKIDELEKSREFRGDLANNLKRATVEQEQEIIQLKRERDAAIHDINKARDCKTCKHINVHPSEQPCRSCGLWGKGFEWRGLCEENGGVVK